MPSLRQAEKGTIHLLVDSTGIKIFGACEWNLQQPKRSMVHRAWQRESGYRYQAGIEDFFFRYKRVLGDGLRAKDTDAQTKESMVGCNVLNRIAELGLPDSHKVSE